MRTIKRFEIKARRVRVEEPGAPYGRAVHAPDRIAGIAAQLLEGEDQECFLAFLLDVKNKVLGYVEAARGGLDTCPVDPRVVFRAAVMQGAAAIIAAHNHPSGDAEPSKEDVRLTERLKQAGDLLGIQLLDHLVLGDGSWCSLAERGLL